MTFRAKPVVVEAFQYDGDFKFNNGEYYVPQWAVDAYKNGTLYFGEFNGVPGELFIKKGDDIQHVALDDYVIRADDGELYACKPDVFKKYFEPVS